MASRLPGALARTRLPVIGAPLFIVSNPALVIAQCKAGIVGSFPALNARPQGALAEWLRRITGELGEHDSKHPERPAAPYAVNQIVHRSNDRLLDDLATCAEVCARAHARVSAFVSLARVGLSLSLTTTALLLHSS